MTALKVFLIVVLVSNNGDFDVAFPFDTMEACNAALASGRVDMNGAKENEATVIRQCVMAEVAPGQVRLAVSNRAGMLKSLHIGGVAGKPVQ